jgi:hypothetical protein
MSLYKQFKTDNALEKDGILLEYGENSRGKPICIRVARAGGANNAYVKRMEARVKPYRRQIQNETMELAMVERIVKEVYAETVILGWENVEFPVLDAQGNPTDEFEELPYTTKNCIRLFNDLPDLFNDIQEQAQRAVLFRAEVREVDKKN